MYDTFRAFMGRPGSDFEHARENHEMRQAHSTPGGRNPHCATEGSQTRRSGSPHEAAHETHIERMRSTPAGERVRTAQRKEAGQAGRTKPARRGGRNPRERALGSARRGRRAKPARAKRTRAEAGSPHETAGETHAGRVREAAGNVSPTQAKRRKTPCF